jgi:sulfotransferase
MKTYHFLAGLPRTGNTLLSSILNQNPKMYSSPLSPVCGMLWDFEQSIIKNENATRQNTKAEQVSNKIIVNYYENMEQEIIIDREKAWATPANLQIIKKYITPTPKIIFTYRPVIEILASFISMLPDHSYIDTEIKNSNWWYKDYLTKNDNRVDYLMRPYGQIDKMLLSINEIMQPENQGTFCFIKYDNIVTKPQDTMNKIYNFLELPNYQHDFNNITKLEIDDDLILGQPKDLHKIRPQLKKTSQDPKEVLSEYVINKYSNIGWEM